MDVDDVGTDRALADGKIPAFLADGQLGDFRECFVIFHSAHVGHDQPPFFVISLRKRNDAFYLLRRNKSMRVWECNAFAG